MSRGHAAREIEAAVARALGTLDPVARVRDSLSPMARGVAVRVVAIGKAAPAMALGARQALQASVERVLVVAPHGVPVPSALRAARNVEVLFAPHPLPDVESVLAAERCLAFVGPPWDGVVVVLVSGGASSLACAPAPGVSLAKKRSVTRAMLASGARIDEINVVRKHLSRIKGGGLLRAAYPNRVITVVSSDVFGREKTAALVGSGPSLPDASTVARARRLLVRYAPAFAEVPLGPTLSPRARAGEATSQGARVVICPEDFAAAVRDELAKGGRRVRVLTPSSAPADAIARELSGWAKRMRPGDALVRVAEPAVRLGRRHGQGGRSTHIAALVGRALHALPAGFVFAAIATDGVDGASQTAGAIVTSSFSNDVAARLGSRALEQAIVRFDTGALHRTMGTARAERPTGQNFADLHVLLRT